MSNLKAFMWLGVVGMDIVLSPSLFGYCFAGSLDPKSHNKQTFEESEALCQRSKCAECGTYSYLFDGRLFYVKSPCETYFSISEGKALQKQNSERIRRQFL